MRRLISVIVFAFLSGSALANEHVVDCENAMNTKRSITVLQLSWKLHKWNLINTLKRALSTMHMMRSWSVQSRWLKTVGKLTLLHIVTRCIPSGVMVQFEVLWRFLAKLS